MRKLEEVVARVSVQLQLAVANKKIRKTNEILQKQITEANLENMDMQQDFLYSLMQIKQEKETPKDYERIRDFYNFITKQLIEESQYSEELDENFINDAIKKVFS